MRGSVPCVMDEPTASSMVAFFRQQADQPLGDVRLASGRTLAPFSTAGLMAAENLLASAERALAEGDLERMNHFVDRAAQLNYDEHETDRSRRVRRQHDAVRRSGRCTRAQR